MNIFAYCHNYLSPKSRVLRACKAYVRLSNLFTFCQSDFKMLMPVYILTNSVLSMFFMLPWAVLFLLYIFKSDRWIMEFCYFNFHFWLLVGFKNVLCTFLCKLLVYVTWMFFFDSFWGWRAYFLLFMWAILISLLGDSISFYLLVHFV